MSRTSDVGVLLERRLVAHAAAAGCTLAVVEAAWVRWASATFTGARHTLTVSGADDRALAGWLAALPEAELPLAGHLVADIVVAGLARADGRLTAALEALTLEDR